MDFYVGIASYKRPEASRTLDYLDSLGFPKERRILSVQTEEDRDAYAAPSPARGGHQSTAPPDVRRGAVVAL